MIISASRRTDIPAFYSEWLLRRVQEGFVMVRNPMNAHQVRRVSLELSQVDCMVFWTKNPAPMIPRLRELDDRGISYYFQFTLTPYDRSVEPNLPDKSMVVATFIELSERIGREKVIWRYDPILVTTDMDLDYHLLEFERMADQLAGHTEKCIISFVDFYGKCRKRLQNLQARDIDNNEIYAIVQGFSRIAAAKSLTIETCAEALDLKALGIDHGKCIDDRLVSRITGRPIEVGKDKSQREHCGCVASVDIGDYDTCSHFCQYCYANHGCDSVAAKKAEHDISSPILTGSLPS